jgi:hypothetical protein
MDLYFKGASVNDRGTLANIKSVMGHHSVQTKVMDSFNHVEHMYDVTCDGLISLLAMEILGFSEYNDEIDDDYDRLTLLDDTVEVCT